MAREALMKLNPHDHARVHVRRALAIPNGFVDADAIAATIHKHYPTTDFQSLINAVIEEAIAARASVTSEGLGGANDVSSNRIVVYETHR